MRRQCSFHFFPTAGRDFEAISQPDLRDLQYPIHIFDVTFDISYQITRRLDLPHIQCGYQGSGQSSSDTGNDVVQRSGVFCPGDFPAILVLIKVLDPAMDSEVEWLLEVLDVGRAMRSFVLLDPNATCVGDGHGYLRCC